MYLLLSLSCLPEFQIQVSCAMARAAAMVVEELASASGALSRQQVRDMETLVEIGKEVLKRDFHSLVHDAHASHVLNSKSADGTTVKIVHRVSASLPSRAQAHWSGHAGVESAHAAAQTIYTCVCVYMGIGKYTNTYTYGFSRASGHSPQFLDALGRSRGAPSVPERFRRLLSAPSRI